MLLYSLTERTQYTVQVIGSPLEANFNPIIKVLQILSKFGKQYKYVERIWSGLREWDVKWESAWTPESLHKDIATAQEFPCNILFVSKGST